MNTERVLALADHIETVPQANSPITTQTQPGAVVFDMGDWLSYEGLLDDGPPCGAVGCIAGLCYARNCNETRIEQPLGKGIGEWARQYLGLSNEQADALFIPRAIIPANLDKVTPADAARALRRAAEAHTATGTFDETIWDHSNVYEPPI